MIQKYVRIPLEVEAIQWIGNNIDEIKDFAGDHLVVEMVGNSLPKLYIKDSNPIYIWKGDYVVKVNNNFRIYSKNDFENLYKRVGDEN